MGTFAIITGYITFIASDNSFKSMYEHNKRVIDNIPQTDDYPFLNSEVFQILPFNKYGEGITYPLYLHNIITFGGTYDGFWSFDSMWVRGFENILKLLYFDEAYAEINTTGVRYGIIWTQTIFRRKLTDDDASHCTLSRKCYKIDFTETDENEVITEL